LFAVALTNELLESFFEAKKLDEQTFLITKLKLRKILIKLCGTPRET